MKAIDHFDIKNFIVSSELFNSGDYRLNSDFYEAVITSNAFHRTETFKLKEIASVFHPGITKRSYIENPEHGIPFLSTSDMQFYEATENKYVSKELSKNLQDYIVEDGCILISRSGTIGSIAIVDNNIDGCAVTEHAIRVALNDKRYFGFIYTFLSSEIGQKIIKGQKSGAVIDEIYDADIENLAIPIIDDKVIAELNRIVLVVKKNREQAMSLVRNARLLVLKYNNLATISEEEVKKLDITEDCQIRLASSKEFTHDFRLDAHFYSNIFKSATELIVERSTRYTRLVDLTTRIFMGNRFARNLVDGANGILFIGTKNILQIRPSELKFLSSSETTNIGELLLNRNWILLARSGSLGGTFGKVSFVWKNFEKVAGSEHIIRVCPDESKIDPGYLFAYLNSSYGYLGITQLKHGALIDEIDPEDLGQIIIPIPSKKQQLEIGDLVRQAFDLRADAIRLEDKAQAILAQVLTKA